RGSVVVVRTDAGGGGVGVLLGDGNSMPGSVGGFFGSVGGAGSFSVTFGGTGSLGGSGSLSVPFGSGRYAVIGFGGSGVSGCFSVNAAAVFGGTGIGMTGLIDVGSVVASAPFGTAIGIGSAT